jgi:hypothetical protein
VNGSEYEYLDVPLSTVIQMLTSQSVGQYFAAFIRDRFAYRAVSTSKWKTPDKKK